MGYPLEVLIFGLLSTGLLWEGVQCLLEKYKLNATRDVSVQEGLCVIISCNFTYDDLDDGRGTAAVHGFWYKVNIEPLKRILVATNDGSKNSALRTFNHFNLSGDLEQGDCSLSINAAQTRDNGRYFFRVEKKPGANFDYLQFDTPYLRVTKRKKPEIQILGKLRAGKPVNITCTAPGSCSLNPANITWGGISEKATSGISDTVPNGTQVYSSVFNFIPSVADYGQNLTCRVSYRRGKPRPVSMEQTIRLNVNYPPQMPQLSGELIRSNKSMQNLTGVSRINAQKGDSVVLRCEVKGNPSPKVSWVREPQSSKSLTLASDNTLKLSDLTHQHEGEYKCWTRNTEGSNNATFQLSLGYSPRPCNKETSHCWRDGSGFQCNCSICSSPPPMIKWQVNGETLEGNTTKGKMEVTTWIKEDVGTSTLHFTGHWDGEHRITCHGANWKGEVPIIFILFSSAGGPGKWKIISGVIGTLVMLVIILLIITVILTSKKCQKGRKSVTGSKSYTKQPTHDQGMVLPKVKDSSIIGGNEFPKVPEKRNESIYENPNEPEYLHYAALQFRVQKNIPETIAEEPQTEYAEIKTS